MAGSKKPLEEKIVLKWEAQTDDAKKAFADIVSLAKASVKTIIQANTNYNKKIKQNTEAQIKSLMSLEKAQEAYNNEFLNSSKHWQSAQKKVLAMYDKLSKAQTMLEIMVVAGDKRQTKQIQAMRAGLEGQTKAVEALVEEMNQEAAAFKKTSDQIQQYKKMLEEAAEVESGKMGDKGEAYLEEKKKSIDEIIEKMTMELKIAGQTDDVTARMNAHLAVKKKAVEEITNLQRENNKAAIKKGIINTGEGLMQKAGVPGAGPGGIDKLVGTLTEAGNKLQTFGGIAGNVGGMLTKLGGAVSTVTGMFFGMATLLAGALIYLDNMKKEQNKRLYAGIGGAGAGTRNDMTALSQRGVMYNQAQNMGPFTDGLRTTQEEVDKVMNSMQNAGMTVKALGGNFTELVGATDTAVTAARNFGISVEEGGKLVADYQDAWNYSSKTLRHNFAIMTQDIKESGMATSKFLSIMQGLQSHFNEFLDQTLTFSKLLKDIGSSGAFSQKQMEKMVNTIDSLQTKGQDQALRRVALNSGAFKKQAGEELAEVNEKLKTATGSERTSLLFQQANLKRSMSGNMIDRATGVEGGMSAARQVRAMAEGSGIKSLNDVKDMMFGPNAGSRQRIFAEKNNMSLDQVKPMLQAMMAVMIQNPQLGTAALTSGRGAEQFGAEKEASESAALMAKQTVSGMGALTETTNTILYTIANGIEALVNAIHDLVSWFTKKPTDAYKKQSMDEAKAAMDAENKGRIQRAKDYVTGQSSSTPTTTAAQQTLNDLLLNNKKFPVDAKAVAAAQKNNVSALTPLPSATPGGISGVGPGGFPLMSAMNPAAPPTTVGGTAAAGGGNAQATAQAGGNTINVQAVLQLKDNMALETIVKKVNAQTARNQQQ